MADEVFTVGYKIDSSGVEGDAEAAGKAAKAGFERGFGVLEIKPKISTDAVEQAAKHGAAVGKAFHEAASKVARDEGGRFAVGGAAKVVGEAAEEAGKRTSKIGHDLAHAAEVGVLGLGTLKTALTGLTEFMATGSFAVASRNLKEFTESAAKTGEATGGVGASLAKAAPYITAFTLTTGAAAVGAKEFAERGADAVLSMDALSKSSGLGVGQILAFREAAEKQGIDFNEFARGLARMNIAQIRARAAIEQRAAEEPLDLADAQERVVKAYRAREAAVDAVGAAEDKVVSARAHVAMTRVGAREEAEIAEVRGPLTVTGAAVGVAGAGAAAEAADIRRRQFEGERVTPQEIYQAQRDQIEASSAAAQYNVAEAQLRYREAQNQERERLAGVREEGGPAGVAQRAQQAAFRDLNQAMRDLRDAMEGVPAAGRGIARATGALGILPQQQITGVAEMIRNRDPRIAAVDPSLLFPAIQLLGQGQPGGTLGAMQGLFQAAAQPGPNQAALQAASNALVQQSFGARGAAQAQDFIRLLREMTQEEFGRVQAGRMTPEDVRRFGPVGQGLAIQERTAEEALRSKITTDALDSMSKTVPLVAKGFETMGSAVDGLLKTFGLVPAAPAGEGGAAPAGEGGVGGVIGEHPLLTGLAAYLGLKGAGSLAGRGVAAGGAALWSALFGGGAGAVAGEGAGLAAGAVAGAGTGAVGGPVGIVGGAALGAIVAAVAAYVISSRAVKPEAPKPEEAKPPPAPEPAPAAAPTGASITVESGGVARQVQVPLEGQAPPSAPAAPVPAPVIGEHAAAAVPPTVPAAAAPAGEAGAGALSGAAGALNGAAGALSGAASALSGAAGALSSAGAVHAAAAEPVPAAPAGADNAPLTAVEQASGGLIQGSGDDVSDTIPIMASPHEYVVKAARVRQLGVPFLDRLNRGEFAKGGLIRSFAEGGLIDRAIAAGVSLPRAAMEGMSDEDLQIEINRARVVSAIPAALSALGRGTMKDVRLLNLGLGTVGSGMISGAELVGRGTLMDLRLLGFLMSEFERGTVLDVQAAGRLLGRGWDDWLKQTMREAPHQFSVRPPPPAPTPAPERIEPTFPPGRRSAPTPAPERAEPTFPPAPAPRAAPPAPRMVQVEVQRHGTPGAVPAEYSVPEYTPEMEAIEQERQKHPLRIELVASGAREEPPLPPPPRSPPGGGPIEMVGGSGAHWGPPTAAEARATYLTTHPEEREDPIGRSARRTEQAYGELQAERAADLAMRSAARPGSGGISEGGYAFGGLIPARVSNGEYRMGASTVSRLGVGFMDALNAGRRLQYGGPVGSQIAYVPTGSPFQERQWAKGQEEAAQVFGMAQAGAGYAGQYGFGGAGLTSLGAPGAVSAGAGGAISEHTLNLVTAGGTFTVGATGNTIAAIQASAIGDRMTSTGSKPSWY